MCKKYTQLHNFYKTHESLARFTTYYTTLHNYSKQTKNPQHLPNLTTLYNLFNICRLYKHFTDLCTTLHKLYTTLQHFTKLQKLYNTIQNYTKTYTILQTIQNFDKFAFKFTRLYTPKNLQQLYTTNHTFYKPLHNPTTFNFLKAQHSTTMSNFNSTKNVQTYNRLYKTTSQHFTQLYTQRHNSTQLLQHFLFTKSFQTLVNIVQNCLALYRTLTKTQKSKRFATLTKLFTKQHQSLQNCTQH